MGWLDNIVSTASNGYKNYVQTVGGLYTGDTQARLLGQKTPWSDKTAQVLGTPDWGGGNEAAAGAAAAYPTATILNASEQQRARAADYQTGLKRGQDLFRNDPEMKDILDRRKSMLQGMDAKEMVGARDQMVRGIQGQQQQGLRQLMGSQARAGVGGARAAAQQAAFMNTANINRSNAEQDFALKNYDLKRQGLNDYSQAIGQRNFGEMASAIGEQQLGVSDRTGAQQAMIANSMAQAANQQPKKGLLSSIFSGLI